MALWVKLRVNTATHGFTQICGSSALELCAARSVVTNVSFMFHASWQCWSESGLVSPAVSPSPQGQSPSPSPSPSPLGQSPSPSGVSPSPLDQSPSPSPSPLDQSPSSSPSPVGQSPSPSPRVQQKSE